MMVKKCFWASILAFAIAVSPVNALSETKEETAHMKPVQFEFKENGLRVILLTRPSLPIVNMRALVIAGELHETKEKNGLANLTASLLTEGTKSKTAHDISEEIDFIGGSLSSGGDKDYSIVSLRVLKKDIDKGVQLFSDVLINPSFPDEEIKRLKTEIKSGIMAEKDEPMTVARKAFNKLLFGEHPYSRPVEGTEETIDNIDREDIISFYKKSYRPNNTIMAIVGDITQQEVLSLLKKYFSTWEKKTVTFPEIKNIPEKRKQTQIIDRKLTQANILMGHIGIDRSNPDFYGVVLMNHILGGGGTSRLYEKVREQKGLAYSVYSSFNSLTYPAEFAVKLQTKNNSAKEAIDIIMSEIKNIREKPISDKEIADAKSYIIGGFPLRIDTNSETVTLLSFIEYYGLGTDYFDMYRKKIESLTAKDLQKVAQQYLDPENYLLVVTGNKEEIGL